MLGGEGGIRTLETREGLTVFKTVAFDHSATSPFINSNERSIIIKIWLKKSISGILLYMADETKNPQSIDVGKELITWSFPEYQQYDRGPLWYLVTLILASGLMAFAYQDRNFLFIVMILLVLFILFTHHRRDPLRLTIALHERGVHIGRDFFLYRDIASFAVLYEPPHVKKLYLFPKNSLLQREYSIPLMNTNPLEVRKILLDYVREDLEKEEESTHESLSRLLKF